MRVGVIVFPGSNCDHDCYHAMKHAHHQEVAFVWHKETRLDSFDVVVLPGGFSYGDYLRTGAVARFSPVMRAVVDFADSGGLVLGICNGFQILCEAGLLPGALLRNQSLRFVCKYVSLKVENADTAFSSEFSRGEVVRMPVAHAEGCYYADAETARELERRRQVVFRYSDNDGEATGAANPNGSLQNIAGIINRRGNVLGMMPHPDRCYEAALGSEDGGKLFASLLHAEKAAVAV